MPRRPIVSKTASSQLVRERPTRLVVLLQEEQRKAKEEKSAHRLSSAGGHSHSMRSSSVSTQPPSPGEMDHHDRTMTITPRRRSGDRREPVLLTRERIESYFSMPLSAASRDLGLCATAIKKVCRRLGIPKWPFRDRMLAQKRELHHEAEVSEDIGAESSEEEKEEDDVKVKASSRRTQRQQEREREHVQIMTARETSLQALPEQLQGAATSQATAAPRAEEHQMEVVDIESPCTTSEAEEDSLGEDETASNTTVETENSDMLWDDESYDLNMKSCNSGAFTGLMPPSEEDQQQNVGLLRVPCSTSMDSDPLISQFLAQGSDSGFVTGVEDVCLEEDLGVGNLDAFDYAFFGCQSA